MILFESSLPERQCILHLCQFWMLWDSFAQIAEFCLWGRLASVHASYLSKYLESAQGDLEMVVLLVGFFFLDHLNASEFFN